jgi:hypothetical protein
MAVGKGRGIAVPAVASDYPTVSDGLGPSDAGLVMYDSTEERLMYWDGEKWLRVATV